MSTALPLGLSVQGATGLVGWEVGRVRFRVRTEWEVWGRTGEGRTPRRMKGDGVGQRYS